MINYEFPPIGGGAGNANFYMLKEFAKRQDIQVDLITFSDKNENYVDNFSQNIRIHKVKAGNKKNLQSWGTFEQGFWLFKTLLYSRKLIKKRGKVRFDLVHCWSGFPSGFAGLWIKKIYKIPYIVGLRGSDIPGYNSRPMLRLLEMFGIKLVYKAIWKRAEEITVLSDDSKKMAKELLKTKYIKIINGIDQDEFFPNRNYELNLNKIKLLFVGRFVRRKGIIELLKSIKKLVIEEKIKNFELKMVGEGDLYNFAKGFIKENNLEQFIKLTGRIEHEKIAEEYRKADIFVLPSLTEALGNVTQEAIASGLPVITTDTGAAEFIDGNGIIVSIGNISELTAGIKNLIENPKLIQEYRRRSIEIGKTMSWKFTADNYIELYKNALS